MSLKSQWRLPGPSSSCLVVWWHDEAARDARRRLPLGTALFLVRTWLRSNRLALRRIDEALGQQFVERSPRMDRDGDVERLGQRLVEALKSGKLVVVQAPAASKAEQGVPASAKRDADEAPGVTVMVVDETGTPVPNADYRIQTTQGVVQGTVDSEGRARKPGASLTDASEVKFTLTK